MCFPWLSYWCRRYKLYDLTTRKFLTSRDALFHEDKFLFKTFTKTNSNPFLEFVLPSSSSQNTPSELGVCLPLLLGPSIDSIADIEPTATHVQDIPIANIPISDPPLATLACR